jgi:hypothetical protein
MPPISPTLSDVADRQEAMSFRLRLNWEERLRNLEIAIKRLQEYNNQPMF